jgi:hypothetical protein
MLQQQLDTFEMSVERSLKTITIGRGKQIGVKRRQGVERLSGSHFAWYERETGERRDKEYGRGIRNYLV